LFVLYVLNKHGKYCDTGKEVFAMIAKTIVLVIVLVSFGTFAYAADCNNGGRYEDMGNGTVQDCRTGLIWLKDANCTDSLDLPGIDKSGGYLTWYDALKWVAAFHSGHCGLLDYSEVGFWRLPTITEWMAMVAYANKQAFFSPSLTNAAGTAKWTTNGDAFNNVRLTDFYWSSTPCATQEYCAWSIDFANGGAFTNPKDMSFFIFVWPVRGGQSGEFGSVIIQ
jgi:hypothetical protein